MLVAPLRVNGRSQGSFILKPFNAVYEVAIPIFRLLALSIQYSQLALSIALRRWCFFSYAIPLRSLTIPSFNIGAISILPKSIITILSPLRKSDFKGIGKEQSLRLTHAIHYSPASGLCVGMSFAFLLKYLEQKNDKDEDSLLAAANELRFGGTEESAKLQAIYYALMGVQGRFNVQEKDLFLQILIGSEIDAKVLNPDLLDSVKSFVTSHSEVALRKFILDDLERKKIEITPNVYTLILELDASWHAREHPEKNKYETIHQAVVSAVARSIGLDACNSTSMKGDIPVVIRGLKQLANGSYLMQFSNHSIALIKTENHIAVFDPNDGLATDLPNDDALKQLLEYYGNASSVSLTLHLIENQMRLDRI